MSLIRLGKVIVKAFKREPLHFTDPSEITLRVYPNDLDINIHMNNARYASMMDVGRFDFLIRSGLMHKMRHENWRPVIGSAYITYYKPLKIFQKFHVHSRVIYWDEKWFYLEQIIKHKDMIMTHAYVKCLFLKKRKEKIPTEDLLIELQEQALEKPTPPEALLKWLGAEELLKMNKKDGLKAA